MVRDIPSTSEQSNCVRDKAEVIEHLKAMVNHWMDEECYLLALRSIETLREIAPLSKNQWARHPLSICANSTMLAHRGYIRDDTSTTL